MVFRWNITKREQLGRLGDDGPAVAGAAPGEIEPSYHDLLRGIRDCSARVLAMAGDARLVFVGRSPESLYDYLMGALSGTPWADRLTLVNLSFRDVENGWAGLDEAARAGICAQLRALELDPSRIASAPRPIAFVDLICEGITFENLLGLLFDWAEDEGVDVRAVRRRIRIVGITSAYVRSVTPVQWKRLDWARRFRPSALRGVSVPWWLWSYLGNTQRKVSRANPPWRWADPTMACPPREREHIHALRMAVALYQAGRSRRERDALAAELATQPAMRHAWCRLLASEIRSAGRLRRVERTFASKHRVRSRRRSVTNRNRSP